MRALSPSTLVEKIRVKKEAIRNKLRSFKKALNKEATTTLNKADPIIHPSLKKIAPRLQEIRTELDNLAKSQEKLSAYKLSKINPFKAHPIVPLRSQEYGLLREAIELQEKLPYYDPEGHDQVTYGVVEKSGRSYFPTFHDGSSAVHAPYYGRTDDLVMGENDFLRHLKELESHGPEPDQDGVFIAPYPSFHEEIDDLEKRLGHVYSSQQRDLIKRRLAWLTAQREELYQTDGEAFEQDTAEQVWRVVNGITATANTWLIYAYEHLKTNALEHAVSFGLGLLIPISLIAIRRWRDPLD